MPHFEDATVPLNKKIQLLTESAIRTADEEKKPLGRLSHEIFGHTPKSKKFQSTIELLSRVFPQKATSFIEKMTRSHIDMKELPFSEDDLQFSKKVSHGYVNEVFLLESQKKDLDSMVLKLNYIDHGASEDLARLASEQNAEYEEISELYKELPGFIPWQASLIVESPQTKKPVIATLQEFQGGKMNDLFEDYTYEELLSIFEDDTQLRESFLLFSELTLSHWEEEREIIDLLGKQNLNIVEDGENRKLLFIDPEGIFHEGDRTTDIQDLYAKRIQYLRELMTDLRSTEE